MTKQLKIIKGLRKIFKENHNKIPESKIESIEKRIDFYLEDEVK